jgi:hypothetical protein
MHPRREMSVHYFSCSGGPGAISIKSVQDTLRRTCVFAFGMICGSRSVFQCVCAMKHRHTILHTRVGPIQIRQKVHRNTLRPTCVFKPSVMWTSTPAIHSPISASSFWCRDLFCQRCYDTLFLAHWDVYHVDSNLDAS